jgi:hypothetical protein
MGARQRKAPILFRLEGKTGQGKKKKKKKKKDEAVLLVR